MAIKYSANAVLAMVRTMYGRRLRREDLEAMAGCRTVGEVADRLRSNSDFASQFASVRSVDLRRGTLETLLDERQKQRIASISKYEKTMGLYFYRYQIVRDDTDVLINLTRLLGTGSIKDQLLTMPDFYFKNTELDLNALSGASDFESVLTALRGTEYLASLEPCAAEFAATGDVLPVEQALLEHRRRVLKRLARQTGGAKSAECELFRRESDVQGIIMLYRLLKLGIDDRRVRLGCFSSELTMLTRRQKETLASYDDPSQLRAALARTPYGDLTAALAGHSFEHVARAALCREMHDRLHYSTDPTEALYAYMYLSDNEIRNIVRVCEGVRYALSVDRIMESIIMGD